jgi:hypothetical protein
VLETVDFGGRDIKFMQLVDNTSALLFVHPEVGPANGAPCRGIGQEIVKRKLDNSFFANGAKNACRGVVRFFFHSYFS